MTFNIDALVLPPLEKLISYQDEDKNSEYDKTLQQILQKVNLTSLEVSAIAGGLDCEEEKAEQLANYIIRIQRKHERNLTVALKQDLLKFNRFLLNL